MSISDQSTNRLDAIDLVRGFAVVLMAIDHVRDFFYYASTTNDPMATGSIEFDLFFTRFITHFCAPTFIFLAGTSAGLMALRKSKHDLAQHLIKRGLWLIFVEVVIISFGWTFSPFGIPEIGGATLIIMQVIWAIGASMIILGILQYLPVKLVLAMSITIILGHNLLDNTWPKPGNGGFDVAPLWVALHAQSSVILAKLHLFFVYPLLPWIGVMALGFSTARVFSLAPGIRKKSLLIVGISLCTTFMILRLFNLYGEPIAWISNTESWLQTTMNFMNVSKYPPSLLFLCMTLGPCFILLALAENCKGKLAQILTIFGRTPFLFYVAHIYLIHLLASLTGIVLGHNPEKMIGSFIFYPEDWGFSLPIVYIVWLAVLLMLYPLCAWFAKIKKTAKNWWLSYL
ncbi:DUF1624 domain-containing protein [Colwellia hornerae]|nr:heparan-alpha-glucosaminide N-acetyltransferase domain-containing protein [Colwellia hornerae]